MLSPTQGGAAARPPCIAFEVFGVVDRPASNSAAARVTQSEFPGQHHVRSLGVFATEGAPALFALALDSGRRGRMVGDGYPHLPPPTPTEEAAGHEEPGGLGKRKPTLPARRERAAPWPVGIRPLTLQPPCGVTVEWIAGTTTAPGVGYASIIILLFNAPASCPGPPTKSPESQTSWLSSPAAG